MFDKYLLHEYILHEFYILYRMFLIKQYFKYPILNSCVKFYLHVIIYLTSYVLLDIQDVSLFIYLFICSVNSNTENMHPLCGQLYQGKFIDVGFLHQRIVTLSHFGCVLADCF